MIEYVAGFLFSEDRRFLALVRKEKPAWQKGRLNAIGGKIELGETPIEAQRREFLEETGVNINDWHETAVLEGDGFRVHFFHAFDDAVHNVRTMETEEIDVHSIRYGLHRKDAMLPNLPVLISLALDDSGIVRPVHLRDERAQPGPHKLAA